MNEQRPRDVVILGSTGSIGTQALDLVRANPDKFRVVGLTAGGANRELFEAQVAEFAPKFSGLGEEASVDAAAQTTDVVLNGITGAVGLRPTLAALEAGNTLALANKESLIIGGPLVKRVVSTGSTSGGTIVPVDSEHSAIAQSLRAGRADEVRKLVLTASGGPFRGRSRDELAQVTPAQALKHPNFAMGRVITTNSATLVNKGLEVIEAHLLFDVPFDRIEVVVHPQQYIHSMVEFTDGAVVAQLGLPTMLVPISMGMAWPDRVPDAETPIDWTKAADWRFEPLDDSAFPAIRLAREAGTRGGTHPAVYNAANEVCVDAFHEGLIPFPGIVDTIAEVMAAHHGVRSESTLSIEDVLAADAWAREAATRILETIK
ncbi:1-deoxy-D-xylulose-5-phosphate reductoisomerase [Nocardioides albus]|uniref:1-deoxy-D-xylulose 5-phosphate reductoisomerase n=1 Tax=Nocardioides albus TaxID=1841 RepID=A0A7W5AA96_9ACTN|nr:1-deoxy-D-xylulose-5-phosphate reductoisomerase [Nocardioides albus]MBB3092254.1 1-deoxy-D-xylulose-5-phosphate reductoisomerase [Nocardioides albus]GGU11590.1 1-deoxy-D-xylulose 5-phosphate reductoisomerase [Nocardioides albus]